MDVIVSFWGDVSFWHTTLKSKMEQQFFSVSDWAVMLSNLTLITVCLIMSFFFRILSVLWFFSVTIKWYSESEYSQQYLLHKKFLKKHCIWKLFVEVCTSFHHCIWTHFAQNWLIHVNHLWDISVIICDMTWHDMTSSEAMRSPICNDTAWENTSC
jgi:hypothetical protein